MDRHKPALGQLNPPLISAAGALNFFETEVITKETSLFCRTALGGITLGSFTIPPRPGNEATYGSTMYHTDEEGATYNAMGLPNPGIEAACRIAPEVVAIAEKAGKIAIFSCAPTDGPDLGDSISQAVYLVESLLATPAHLVELNVSCPNLVSDATGKRKPILGYDLTSMEQLIDALQHTKPEDRRRLGLKLPPYLSDEQKQLVPKIAALLENSGVFSFIVVSNTIPNQIPLDDQGRPVLKLPGNAGGKSGPAAAEVGREQLALWRRHFSGDIISTLGVHDGKEMALRLSMGAAAVSGVSFLWNAARGPAEGVERVLGEFVEEVE